MPQFLECRLSLLYEPPTQQSRLISAMKRQPGGPRSTVSRSCCSKVSKAFFPWASCNRTPTPSSCSEAVASTSLHWPKLMKQCASSKMARSPLWQESGKSLKWWVQRVLSWILKPLSWPILTSLHMGPVWPHHTLIFVLGPYPAAFSGDSWLCAHWSLLAVQGLNHDQPHGRETPYPLYYNHGPSHSDLLWGSLEPLEKDSQNSSLSENSPPHSLSNQWEKRLPNFTSLCFKRHEAYV